MIGDRCSRSLHPLAVVKAMKDAGVDEVIVAYSSGKDSIATLDLCVSHFKRVVPYFMYLVPDLSFQERHHRYIEARYGLEIIRVPDWRLSDLFRTGFCRHFTSVANDSPLVSWRELENYIRKKTGIHWVASGETCGESLARRGMIVGCNGICPKRGHFYPIGWWRKQDVHSYLSQRGVFLPSEYRVKANGKSFGGLTPQQISEIRVGFPEDYEKIKKLFPLIESQVVRRKIMAEREDAESIVKQEQVEKKRAERAAVVAAERDRKRAERDSARLAEKQAREAEKQARKAEREAKKAEREANKADRQSTKAKDANAL